MLVVVTWSLLLLIGSWVVVTSGGNDDCIVAHQMVHNIIR